MGIISDGHGEVFPSCRPQKTRELGRYAHACANGWGTGVHTERPYGFCTQHDLYGRGAHCASAKMCANWHGPSGTPVPTVSAIGRWSVAGRDTMHTPTVSVVGAGASPHPVGLRPLTRRRFSLRSYRSSLPRLFCARWCRNTPQGTRRRTPS